MTDSTRIAIAREIRNLRKLALDILPDTPVDIRNNIVRDDIVVMVRSNKNWVFGKVGLS